MTRDVREASARGAGSRQRPGFGARPRLRLTNVALVMVASVVALVIVELILRAFYPQQLGVWYNMADGLSIHLPGARTYMLRHGQEVRFNALGMRDREHSVEKAQGTCRILVLGDSFIEALQVALPDSFPRLLESRLSERLSGRVEVVSGAVSGWGTDEELAYLERYGLKLSPDLILIGMTIDNDVFDNLKQTFHTFENGRVSVKSVQRIEGVKYGVVRVKDFMASYSHLWQLARKARNLRAMKEDTRQLNNHALELIRVSDIPRIKKGWQMTFALLRAVEAMGRMVGAETAVFLIPMAIQVEEARLQAFLRLNGVSREEILLERPQRVMSDFGGATGIPVIDLLPVFRRSRQEAGSALYLPNDGHWSAQGHGLAAEAVARELLGRGLVSGSGTGDESDQVKTGCQQRGAARANRPDRSAGMDTSWMVRTDGQLMVHHG